MGILPRSFLRATEQTNRRAFPDQIAWGDAARQQLEASQSNYDFDARENALDSLAAPAAAPAATIAPAQIPVAAPPVAAQPVNGLINMYGDNPSAPSNQHALEASTLTGMPSGTNSQQIAELLARMSPDRLNAAKYKYELRNMTPLQRRAELERVAMDRALGVGGPGRVSVLNPTGPTLDDGADAVGAATQQDYAATSPEIQRLQSKARQSFLRELSDGLSTVDKSRFATIGDYDRWIQSLESVKNSGGLIEGTIFNASRRFLTPNMRAQFEANDQNAKSFMEWGQNQTNRDFNGDGAPDTFAEVWAAANEGDSAASQILDMWRGDPNAKKYEVGPNNQVMQARPSPREIQKVNEDSVMQQARLQEQSVDAAVKAANGTLRKTYGEKGLPEAELTPEARVTKTLQEREIERKANIAEYERQPEDYKRQFVPDALTGKPVPRKLRTSLEQYGGEHWKLGMDDTMRRKAFFELAEYFRMAQPNAMPEKIPDTMELTTQFPGTTPEEARERWLENWRADNRNRYFTMKQVYDFIGFQNENSIAAPKAGAKSPAAAGATAATPQPTPTAKFDTTSRKAIRDAASAGMISDAEEYKRLMKAATKE